MSGSPLNLLSVGQLQQLRHIVEEDSDALVTQGIAEAVLIRIVHPLADPDHWQALGIFGLVLHEREFLGRLRLHDGPQLLVELRQVAVGRRNVRRGAGSFL